MGIKVTRDLLDAMLEASRSAYPREACGILLGQGTLITEFVETRNVHSTPQTHFEIDPQALIEAHRGEREGGPDIIGYFHSHPYGEACPSNTDRAEAAHDGKIWMISDCDAVKCWRDDRDGFHCVPYAIATG